MSSPDVGHPIAHRFVDRLLEGGLAYRHRNDLRAKEFHARDVQGLPVHVDLPHINDAFAAKTRRDGGSGDAVLARARLGNYPPLSHSSGEQNLAERVIDLVRASVKQVLAL